MNDALILEVQVKAQENLTQTLQATQQAVVGLNQTLASLSQGLTGVLSTAAGQVAALNQNLTQLNATLGAMAGAKQGTQALQEVTQQATATGESLTTLGTKASQATQTVTAATNQLKTVGVQNVDEVGKAFDDMMQKFEAFAASGGKDMDRFVSAWTAANEAIKKLVPGSTGFLEILKKHIDAIAVSLGLTEKEAKAFGAALAEIKPGGPKEEVEGLVKALAVIPPRADEAGKGFLALAGGGRTLIGVLAQVARPILGEINPGLAAMSSQMTGVGRIATAMGGTLGLAFGGVVLAIGAAVVAFTAYARALNDTIKDQAALNLAIEKLDVGALKSRLSEAEKAFAEFTQGQKSAWGSMVNFFDERWRDFTGKLYAPQEMLKRGGEYATLAARFEIPKEEAQNALKVLETYKTIGEFTLARARSEQDITAAIAAQSATLDLVKTRQIELIRLEEQQTVERLQNDIKRQQAAQEIAQAAVRTQEEWVRVTQGTLSQAAAERELQAKRALVEEGNRLIEVEQRRIRLAHEAAEAAVRAMELSIAQQVDAVEAARLAKIQQQVGLLQQRAALDRAALDVRLQTLALFQGEVGVEERRLQIQREGLAINQRLIDQLEGQLGKMGGIKFGAATTEEVKKQLREMRSEVDKFQRGVEETGFPLPKGAAQDFEQAAISFRQLSLAAEQGKVAPDAAYHAYEQLRNTVRALGIDNDKLRVSTGAIAQAFAILRDETILLNRRVELLQGAIQLETQLAEIRARGGTPESEVEAFQHRNLALQNQIQVARMQLEQIRRDIATQEDILAFAVNPETRLGAESRLAKERENEAKKLLEIEGLITRELANQLEYEDILLKKQQVRTDKLREYLQAMGEYTDLTGTAEERIEARGNARQAAMADIVSNMASAQQRMNEAQATMEDLNTSIGEWEKAATSYARAREEIDRKSKELSAEQRKALQDVITGEREKTAEAERTLSVLRSQLAIQEAISERAVILGGDPDQAQTRRIEMLQVQTAALEKYIAKRQESLAAWPEDLKRGEAWQQETAAIADAVAKLEQYRNAVIAADRALLEKTDWAAGIEAGFRDVERAGNQWGARMRELVGETASSLADAMSTGFFAVITGQMKDLPNLASQIGKQFLKNFLDQMSQEIVSGAFGMIRKSLQGTFGTGGMTGAGAGAGGVLGGLLGAVGVGMPSQTYVTYQSLGKVSEAAAWAAAGADSPVPGGIMLSAAGDVAFAQSVSAAARAGEGSVTYLPPIGGMGGQPVGPSGDFLSRIGSMGGMLQSVGNYAAQVVQSVKSALPAWLVGGAPIPQQVSTTWQGMQAQEMALLPVGGGGAAAAPMISAGSTLGLLGALGNIVSGMTGPKLPIFQMGGMGGGVQTWPMAAPGYASAAGGLSYSVPASVYGLASMYGLAGLGAIQGALRSGQAVVSGGQIVTNASELAMAGISAPGIAGAPAAQGAWYQGLGQIVGTVGAGALGAGMLALQGYTAYQGSTKTSDVVISGLGGAITGATVGAQIGGGGWGAVIGAVVGAIGVGGAASAGKSKNQRKIANQDRADTAGKLYNEMSQAINEGVDYFEIADTRMSTGNSVGGVLMKIAQLNMTGALAGPPWEWKPIGVSTNVYNLLDELGWVPEEVDADRINSVGEMIAYWGGPDNEQAKDGGKRAQELLYGFMAKRGSALLAYDERFTIPGQRGSGARYTRTTILPTYKYKEAEGQDIYLLQNTINNLSDDDLAQLLYRLAQVDRDRDIKIIRTDSNFTTAINVPAPALNLTPSATTGPSSSLPSPMVGGSAIMPEFMNNP